MRPKLLLHIGMFKTGTTTLQNLMEKQRDLLRRQGVCYPRTDRPPHEHLPKHNSLLNALVKDDAGFRKEKKLLLDEFAASGCHTLVLSEEGLATPIVLRPLVQRRIARLGADFDIEALCMLRREDTWLESLWTQRCREGSTDRHITEFVATPRMQKHLDYLSILDAWGKVAGLKVLGYEQATARGLVRTFTEATGIRLDGEGRYNPGTSFEAAAIMAALRRNGITDFKWELIEKATGRRKRKYALGARLRAEILARSAEQHAELERRYGVVFPADMPNEPEDVLPEPTEATLRRMVSRLALTASAPEAGSG